MAERVCYSNHKEVLDPVSLRVDGEIPSWVKGRLVRMGPGLFNFGEHEAKYPMDGMGLLHAFHIQDGQANFQSRFIASDTMKRNVEAKRFVAAEFGTAASPDPSKGTFAKLKEKMTGAGDMSDNCNHNIIYWKENNALIVPGVPSFVINPATLETMGKVKLPEKLGVDIISEHAHIDKDGAMYLLGSHVRGKPEYKVVKLPVTGDMKASFEAAEVVFTVPGQFKATPTSHHSFIMTENFIVVIECPMELSILKILTKATILEALTWDPSVTCKFHVFNRKTGKAIKHKIESDAFFLLHSSNAYEENNHLVLDLFVFRKFTSKEIFVMRKDLQSPEYQAKETWRNMDLDRPIRFVIPTDEEEIGAGKPGDNLVKLAGEKAEAVVQKATRMQLKDRPLIEDGDKAVHIQYPCINGSRARQPYTYFYSTGYGDSDYLPYAMGKFNVNTKEVAAWEGKDKQLLTEPVFIANPEGSAEDDGVLLFTMLDYAEGNDRLVVVDAKSMSTLAQVYFTGDMKIVLPEADHGVFIPSAE